MKIPTEEQYAELNELYCKVKDTVKIYNEKAKDYGDFSRLAYAYVDKTERVEDIISNGGVVNEDWNPNGYSSFSLSSPSANGWFPSSICP